MSSESLGQLTGRANEDADNKDEHAPDDDLKGSREERRVHVAMADPGDDGEFDRDDDDRDGHGDIEILFYFLKLFTNLIIVKQRNQHIFIKETIGK